MSDLKGRIQTVRDQIPVGVDLMAVSKTRSGEEVREAYALGLREFGENYLQEALPKIEQLKDLRDIRWNFIGALQSKKLKSIVGVFDCIQSLSELKHAEMIARFAVEKGIQQTVLIQTNFGEESTKSGISRDNLKQAIETILPMKGLKLMGVMDMPPVFSDPADAKNYFTNYVREVKELSQLVGWKPEVFSLGTSQDFPQAIQAGSTMVRIGTQIFGPRENKGEVR